MEIREQGKSILLVLIGPPASGKSTFCHAVMSNACRPWTRVCQDVISNGKRGSKKQCVKCALEELQKGKSVLIDRCNMTKDQRLEFIQLGGPKTEVHAVFFDLPTKLCISRMSKRTEHEGGLQGGKAAAAIHRMLQTKEEPSLDEGFCRITFCQTEADVENCMKVYNNLGPSDVLQHGVHGQKKKEVKPRCNILSFFKKETNIKNSVPQSKSSQNEGIQGTDQKFLFSTVSIEKTNAIDNGETSVRNEVESGMVHNVGSDTVLLGAEDHSPTLAFPSISTSDFHFDHDIAADVIVEKVSEFLANYDTTDFRLVMVDLSSNSDMLSRVSMKAAAKGLNKGKFQTLVGDITTLYSKHGLKCVAIANAANWRLKAGGGGVNAAIFKAAGPEFEVVTKKRAKVLDTGKALLVPLPKDSLLHIKEAVTYVIHVVGPNMNPQRPNYLEDDYVKGRKLLEDAYTSLFECFASAVMHREKTLNPRNEGKIPFQSDGLPEAKGQTAESELSGQITGKNDLKMLTEASKRNDFHSCNKRTTRDFNEPGIKKKMKTGIVEHLLQSESATANEDDSENQILLNANRIQKNSEEKDDAKGKGVWALCRIAKHPEKHTVASLEADKGKIFEYTKHVVVVSDLFPKAKKHILVIARLDGLDCLAEVQRKHLPLLQQMHSVGLKWVASFLQEDPSLIFRLGYHSVPSMHQLHLHVISQDFDSSYLKTRKHWNSFTTKFFKDSIDVLEEVKTYGKVRSGTEEELLSMELRCHRCRSVHPNIPRLKSHISSCKSPFPSSLKWGQQLISTPSAGSSDLKES